MKVRKLAVALALAGGLGSGVAQALGLGEIELQSYLNEPLEAEINLRKSDGVSPGDVVVNLAPQSAYERVGIDRSFFLTKLDFEVTTAPDGNLVVNVSSREPLREPYLNFLVEVSWPNGRLMREYAVLVDPPVYAEESGVEDQVSAPESSQAGEPEQQQRQPRQQESRQQAPATGSTDQARTSGSRTLGPTNSADTLWTIAAQVRPSGDVSMQQVMLAIQDLNPGAFINGNINRLKQGEVLRVPNENQIRSRSRAEANQIVATQNQDFATPDRTVDATSDTSDTASNEASGSADGSGGGDQLRLVAADDADSPDSADSGSAGGDGDTEGGADAGSAVAMEELESARRENDELSGRVDDLQDQVETLQRLLELKNTQLADMQNADGESPDEGDPVAGDESSAEPEESAGSEDTGSGDAPEDQQEAASEEPAVADGQESQPSSEDQSSSDETTETEVPATAEEQDEPVADADQPEPAMAEETDPEPAQKPFPDNIIDAIANNFMYQVALGGGLIVLLLLLLLLARRNANREKAFYDQLNNDVEGEQPDSFDLTFDEDDEAEAPQDDAIAEADAYIAYGRNDQAAQTLETAISREPSRTDLRLKLLGVYADIQDRESFDKQFREIEALDDEAATADAISLQNRLEEAESMPSIDDLESQLRSGGNDRYEEPELPESERPDSDSVAYQSPADETDSEEPDFEELNLELPDADDDLPETTASRDLSSEQADADADGEPDDGRDDLIEYDLSGLENEDESDDITDAEDLADADDLDDSFEYSLDDLETDSEESDTVDADDLSLDDLDNFESPETPETPETGADEDELLPGSDAKDSDEADALDADIDADIDGDDELDESFLDELDAELDKVANEEESADDDSESDLDDLELDVSDEDLALMEEFSESDDVSPSDTPESLEEEELSLDDELGLEDALKDNESADPELEVEGAEQVGDKLAEQEPADPAGEDADSDGLVPPVASDTGSSRQFEQDLDESDLGDDDDFDFLAGTDEAATKLDLARAYVEMGDVDGARDILEEVTLEGNDEQKAEAQDLLKNLS